MKKGIRRRTWYIFPRLQMKTLFPRIKEFEEKHVYKGVSVGGGPITVHFEKKEERR